MPIDLMTKGGDLVIQSGITQTVYREKEIMQSIHNRLSTRLGEFFLDTEYGCDYLNMLSLEQKEPDNEEIEFALRECILSDQNVSEIENIIISENKNRKKEINFVVILSTGEILEGGVEIE